MTEQEAIKEVKRWTNILMSAGSKCVSETAEAQDMAIKALEEVQQYRAIGTPEECRAAVEKQRAKKPRKTDSYRGVLKRVYAYVCPTCGNSCLEKYMNERQNTMFCWDCGQKLDWSDEE